MNTTEKKIWPKYFDAIKKGTKNYELRLADFKVKKGDTLILKEWNPKTKKYTGREIKKKAKFVFKTKDQKFWSKKEIKKFGFLIIGF
jgi:co-chaperonin GroES (HSP10)